jgi:hypothetical protein
MANDLDTLCNLASLRVSAFIAEEFHKAIITLVKDQGQHRAAAKAVTDANLQLHWAEQDAEQDAEHEAELEEEKERVAYEARAQEAERVYRATHTWQQYAEQLYPGDGVARAWYAIEAYISAGWHATFGYDCTVNPEGISEDELLDDERETLQLMLAALSTLPDEEIEAAIRGNMDRDFDGTRFAVTNLAEVKSWHAKNGHLSISQQVIAR